MKKALAFVAGLAVVLPLMSACSTRYAVSTSDEHVCVFDGSQRGGQKLKFQVPPGAASKHIDDNDQVVKIPASNRFYWVTLDDSLRDPGAPKTYTGNAAGGAPIYVEGQLRFRFNLAKACDWFSKHGRRNAQNGTDLGFNARGNPADVAKEGWFVYLRENLGAEMQQVVDGGVNTYLWDFLHYNYPVNADPNTGVVPPGQQVGAPTRDRLAAELAVKFTDRLNAKLGGQYFCGIQVDPNGNATACPPIDFEIKYAGPGPNSKLVQDRQQFEDAKNQIRQGDLQQQQQAQLLAAAALKAQLLNKEAESADAQARIDTAKCRQLAPFGLDCNGNRPPTYINGVPAK